MRPGQTCIVAGWGQNERDTLANTLQEVELTIQKDRECKSRFPSYYSRDTQICVGDPKKKMTGFKVRVPTVSQTGPGREDPGELCVTGVALPSCLRVWTACSTVPVVSVFP